MTLRVISPGRDPLAVFGGNSPLAMANAQNQHVARPHKLGGTGTASQQPLPTASL